MRRGWTKSWLRISALALGLLVPGLAAQELPGDHHANEVTLARLRPGSDTLALAEKRFGAKHRVTPAESDDSKLWADPCTGHTLRVEVEPNGVIQSVTVSSLGRKDPDCPGPTDGNGSLYADNLKTGRGLALGDSKKRVFALYGRPNSVVPSTLEGREFELLFYAFDWAGSDVPQVMEVTCEPESGRVRKITLASPSL